MLSVLAPPSIQSLPSPPFRLSGPSPPQMTSSPPRPLIVSAPPRPMITSRPAVPLMMLFWAFPTIVGVWPLQAGTTTRYVHGTDVRFPARSTPVTVWVNVPARLVFAIVGPWATGFAGPDVPSVTFARTHAPNWKISNTWTGATHLTCGAVVSRLTTTDCAADPPGEVA